MMDSKNHSVIYIYLSHGSYLNSTLDLSILFFFMYAARYTDGISLMQHFVSFCYVKKQRPDEVTAEVSSMFRSEYQNGQ